MTDQLRRSRGPLIAVVALVLSAGVVLAAQPAATGITNAGQHAGKSLPVGADEASNEPDESESPDTDSSGGSDANQCNVDLTQPVSVLETLNHGSVVCTAAQMPTPSGYANHGAWVSHWAHLGKVPKGQSGDHPGNGPPAGVPPSH